MLFSAPDTYLNNVHQVRSKSKGCNDTLFEHFWEQETIVSHQNIQPRLSSHIPGREEKISYS